MTHSCRRSPPSPRGCSAPWFGPAASPSSEMEICEVTMPVGPGGAGGIIGSERDRALAAPAGERQQLRRADRRARQHAGVALAQPGDDRAAVLAERAEAHAAL